MSNIDSLERSSQTPTDVAPNKKKEGKRIKSIFALRPQRAYRLHKTQMNENGGSDEIGIADFYLDKGIRPDNHTLRTASMIPVRKLNPYSDNRSDDYYAAISVFDLGHDMIRSTKMSYDPRTLQETHMNWVEELPIEETSDKP